MQVFASSPVREIQNRNNKAQNIQFFRDRKLIDHSDPHLEFSECISITFKMQKKDKKHDIVIQMSSVDVNMCPVQMGAAIMCRI
jgi:hypothetical protein